MAAHLRHLPPRPGHSCPFAHEAFRQAFSPHKPQLLVKTSLYCCAGPLQVRLAKMPQSLGKRKRKKINYREEHGIREAAARLDSDSDPDVGAEGGYSDSVSHAQSLCTDSTCCQAQDCNWA